MSCKNKLRIFLFFLPVEVIFFSGEEQVHNFNIGNMKNICLKLFQNWTKSLNRCHIKKRITTVHFELKWALNV